MQILQILQVTMFTLSALSLLGIGLLILSRTVSIVDRRIYLLVFIPLLLANTLALFEGNGVPLNWRTWLILGADLVLIVGAIWLSRGFQVYGLNAEMAVDIVTETLRQQGYTVETKSAEKRDLWGRTRDACVLTAQKLNEEISLWIITRFNEVSIRTQQRSHTKYLRAALTALRQQEVPYDFKAHAVGVLYIILAVVFAVLTWIFFFEPRLILIE